MKLQNLKHAEGRIKDVERFARSACQAGFPYSDEEKAELVELLRIGARVKFAKAEELRPHEVAALTTV